MIERYLQLAPLPNFFGFIWNDWRICRSSPNSSGLVNIGCFRNVLLDQIPCHFIKSCFSWQIRPGVNLFFLSPCIFKRNNQYVLLSSIWGSVKSPQAELLLWSAASTQTGFRHRLSFVNLFVQRKPGGLIVKNEKHFHMRITVLHSSLVTLFPAVTKHRHKLIMEVFCADHSRPLHHDSGWGIPWSALAVIWRCVKNSTVCVRQSICPGIVPLLRITGRQGLCRLLCWDFFLISFISLFICICAQSTLMYFPYRFTF